MFRKQGCACPASDCPPALTSPHSPPQPEGVGGYVVTAHSSVRPTERRAESCKQKELCALFFHFVITVKYMSPEHFSSYPLLPLCIHLFIFKVLVMFIKNSLLASRRTKNIEPMHNVLGQIYLIFNRALFLKIMQKQKKKTKDSNGERAPS